MKSNCCQAPLWVICGKLKIDAENKIELAALPRGKTCFYICKQCDQACDEQK